MNQGSNVLRISDYIPAEAAKVGAVQRKALVAIKMTEQAHCAERETADRG